jgi:hypothetical protein
MPAESPSEIDLGTWVVDQEFTTQYLDAVDDKSILYEETDLVPPMALAARVLGLLLDKLSLPPGAVHTSQELSALGPIRRGQQVQAMAKISRPLRRGEWEFLSTSFVLKEGGTHEVLKGKTMVMVPVRG